jgi:hypothetical protein
MNEFFRTFAINTALRLFIQGVGFCVALFMVFFTPNNVFATDFTSSNFIIRDPITGGSGGGYATSSNFQLWSSFAQTGIGLSTSSGAFAELRAGFLYFFEEDAGAPPPPPPPPGPPPGGNIPPPPGGPPPLPPPSFPPFPPFPFPIPFPPTLPDCGVELGFSRSDFNCDGKVDLQDLSILLSFRSSVPNRLLSFMFSDWTKLLPIPQFAYVDVEQQVIPVRQPVSIETGLAQLTDVTGTSVQTRIGSAIGTVFRAIGNFIGTIVHNTVTFFTNLLRF